MKDTNEELERLERELLAEEPIDAADVLSLEEADVLLDELLAEDAVPAFDDPDKIHAPKEPMVYCNYSNDYGRDLQDFANDSGLEAARKKRQEAVVLALMITASCLCLGILGVLCYWMVTFLR